jgi:hypothetical protein
LQIILNRPVNIHINTKKTVNPEFLTKLA